MKTLCNHWLRLVISNVIKNFNHFNFCNYVLIYPTGLPPFLILALADLNPAVVFYELIFISNSVYEAKILKVK